MTLNEPISLRATRLLPRTPTATRLLGFDRPATRVEPSLAYRLAKRALDVVAAVTLLTVLSPLFAVVALLIKLTSRGPVLFAQKRVGKGGKEFRFYKFRSMVVDAEARKASLLAQNDHRNGVTFKMKADPRMTWVGKLIRRTSVDELPQLWNVLVGDMTLVGPRPAVPAEVAKYTRRERQRLAVTPGLTCIWQVSGRGDVAFDGQVKMDLDYIRSRSLWLDLALLFRTVPAVLSARGAY